MISLPFLSEYDIEELSEGSLDPLGLYLIADRLAIKLIPGFRERMRHPRFLTAIAVGAHVCSIYDEDVLASDNVTPPYLVYEWQIVQALAYHFKESSDSIGLPGVNKAMNAYKSNQVLSTARYLKTPNVFGFNGVYRTLARDINLVNEIGLGETGDKLLRIWEKEQGLEGFYSSDHGPGNRLLSDLRSAVAEGLKSGTASKGWYWGTNKIISEHLAPYQIGTREGKAMMDAFLNESKPIRKEVFNFLISAEGQSSWKRSKSEKEFHDELHKVASPELKMLLVAIKNYEYFARLLQNVFDDLLFHLSGTGSSYLSDLIKLESVERAWKEIPLIFNLVSEKLSQIDPSIQFEQSFNLFSESCPIGDWLERLIEHHFNIQRIKSSQGKRPWIEKADGGRLLLYPIYLRDKGPTNENEYVHYYRTIPMWSFLKDLKEVVE